MWKCPLQRAWAARVFPCGLSQPEVWGMELLWISSNSKCELLFACSILGLGLRDARGFAVVL